MRYIKKFENNDIQDQDNSFWLIKGNYDHIAKILSIFLKDKFSIKINGLEPAIIIIDDMYKTIFREKKYDPRTVLGVYIGYQEKRYSYWIIESIEDENEGEEHYKEEEYIYRGDLKLENDKLVIDKYRLDAEKYNL